MVQKIFFRWRKLQDHLVFVSANKCVESLSDTQEIYSWKSKGMSKEGTKNLSGSDHNFAKILINSYPISGAKFNGNFLINDNISALRKVINLYISFNLHTWSRYLNTKFTLVYCLFEAMRMTKASDPDKYGYSGYGTGFNECSQFSLPDSSWDKNIICFGVNISSSVYVDNKNNNILVLGESPTQE